MKLSIEYHNAGCKKLSNAVTKLMDANKRPEDNQISVEDSDVREVITKTIQEMTADELHSFTAYFYERMWSFGI
jgi:hypothetical protein